jgi:DNA polymerase III delta prime subunit
MMYGETGTGKTTAAKILASSVENTNTDMFDFGGDSSVDNIRKFLSMTDRNSLFGGRVFILDEFHDVSESNQRKIKKVIEDRTNNRYIFCVNDIQKIIEPIISRCSKLQFDYCELDILDEPVVLPHTGWDSINDWKIELRRVSKMMADKAGKTITDSQYDRVFARGERYVNVRSFIIALEEVITDDDFEAEERR